MRTLPVLATLTLASLASPGHADAPPPAIQAARAPSSADDFEQAKHKLELQLAEDLAGVAKFCDRKKWLMERDRIYEEVLEFDPSHSKARRALKYKKRKGEWEQDDDYRLPRNKGRVDLDTVQGMERECHSQHHDDCLKLLDALEEDLGADRVEIELRSLLLGFPESTEVPPRLGYVQGWEGKPWVMPETKRSRARRRELKALATRLREEAPAAPDAPYLDWEQDLGVEWAGSVQSDRVRVVSSNSARECAKVAEVVWAAQDFVQQVLGIERTVPEGFTVYVMESESDLENFAGSYPGLSKRDRERLPEVASTWLPGGVLLAWTDGGVRRLDSIARQIVALLLTREFHLGARHGWVYEGFGLYLSYKLVGTRLTLTVHETGYVDKPRNPEFLKGLRDRNANWFRLAHEALTGETKPNFVFLLGKDVNRLTAEDLFFSYSLAAFILELRPEKAEPILRRIGKGDAPATVLEEELGQKLPQIEEHVIAWLADML